MAFDYNTMFFDTTAAVTSTATSDAMDFHGPDLTELAYRFVVNGTVSGTTPKIVPTLETSDDNSTFSTAYTFPDITGVCEMNHKFRGKGRWRRAVATVSGTSPSFGSVKVGYSTGGVY
jgi:hypothetical protein